ncbi:carboxypeptidase-like regulatory domain-containing protein [Gaetbulibacter aquiaggeris]|uniref:Carboxypeptidase-like regulatory domain-containing protein n=1 Tax=Gaetbulibacter aquiaggeris TaxID=1735373 RepID=A0ABW7MNM8_9FLAO
MKQLITLLLLTFSSISFAQNTGLIVGKVTDKELNNEPLMFASISVKGTAIASETDFTGIFLIENLAEGDYTLVCNFIGYETKELTIRVSSMQPTEINISLAPSTISINELTALSSVAKKDDKTAVALNN